MNNNLDKKAIREKIEALRQKIKNNSLEPILEKTAAAQQKNENEHYLGEKSFFYILETKTLLISIIICSAIIATAYILSLKTNYLDLAANFIFKLFS
ncbi:MAG: hypothetical protein PHW50_00750 [Patescibacteria group bacterium]|nr:hypothetical protein [Patescibacteria group bacterium]